MVVPSRFITGTVDALPHDYISSEPEDHLLVSKTFSIKKYKRGETPTQNGNSNSVCRSANRRNRKERVNYERSPINLATNRYAIKHTYTKLEHDETGPKFTVIK
mmetsp:Transcript_15439/g.17905  ORF Transcript_15439/g.17905 Transcript_15439/m.17905 type:complete len:104 (-) Transcript_15439:3-314(-)